jgi:hypothetical protein
MRNRTEMPSSAEPHRVILAIRRTIVVAGVVCLACGGRPQTLTGPTTVPLGTQAQTPAPNPTPAPVILPTEILVGAGDIGMCGSGGNPQATAKIIDSIDGTVVTLGDNAYPNGSALDYKNCYDTSWGRFKGRTRPVPGNHEYDSDSTAQPYFDYFGAAAGPVGAGFYSYDLGNWHIIALNSNLPDGANSAQGAWLRNDLAASSAKCTLAYFHYPLFSSSEHGNIESVHATWQILYNAGADVVLSGHDHTYERFALQDPGGAADPVNGIREFVVGTGGAGPYQFTNVRPNSEVRLSTNGVIKLALKFGGYDWNFISTSGPGDSGSGTCH